MGSQDLIGSSVDKPQDIRLVTGSVPTSKPLVPDGLSLARLAQSVERETLNLKVAGSTPASGSIPDASQSTEISNPSFFSPSL
ncbi:hypothetical protein GGS26DRAFT_107498 [Hypomontagnella submonticulosa]|nr:hypothetical protein GGS26DRAFT_107498 [Hypomontagnella submonticulosa]